MPARSPVDVTDSSQAGTLFVRSEWARQACPVACLVCCAFTTTKRVYAYIQQYKGENTEVTATLTRCTRQRGRRGQAPSQTAIPCERIKKFVHVHILVGNWKHSVSGRAGRAYAHVIYTYSSSIIHTAVCTCTHLFESLAMYIPVGSACSTRDTSFKPYVETARTSVTFWVGAAYNLPC